MPPWVVATWTAGAPAAESAILILRVSAASSRIRFASRVAPPLACSSAGGADCAGIEMPERVKSIAVEATRIVLMIDLLGERSSRCIFRACSVGKTATDELDAESCRAAGDDPWYTTA